MHIVLLVRKLTRMQGRERYCCYETYNDNNDEKEAPCQYPQRSLMETLLSLTNPYIHPPPICFSSSPSWKVIMWSSIYSTLPSITPRPGHACFSTISFVIIVVVIIIVVIIAVIVVIVIIVVVITMRCGSGGSDKKGFLAFSCREAPLYRTER